MCTVCVVALLVALVVAWIALGANHWLLLAGVCLWLGSRFGGWWSLFRLGVFEQRQRGNRIRGWRS
jgi:hypothetical protein